MSGHTPGPWQARSAMPRVQGGSVDWAVFASWGEAVCSINRTPDSQADALLIAAAPELLNIAREYLDDIEGDYGPNIPEYYAPLTEKLRAVIAKATQP